MQEIHIHIHIHNDDVDAYTITKGISSLTTKVDNITKDLQNSIDDASKP